MYNLRYHVASLVAAFLFLSVGLLLGTIVAERGTLDAQRDTIISSLREQFETLSAENSALSAQNADQGEFIDDTLPLMLAGQLEDQYVMVIGNSGRADGISAVSDAITSAGGIPVVVTARAPQLGLSDPAVSEVATSFVEVSPQDEEAYADAIARALAEEWTTPSSGRELTEMLLDAGAFSMNGDLPASAAASSIVTLAAWDGVPDAAALALARAMSLAGAPSAGVEMSTQDTGVAVAAVGEGLSAVEDPGTPEGDYSLVFVLSGRASGHFGSSAEAGARHPVFEPETAQP